MFTAALIKSKLNLKIAPKKRKKKQNKTIIGALVKLYRSLFGKQPRVVYHSNKLDNKLFHFLVKTNSAPKRKHKYFIGPFSPFSSSTLKL